MSETSMIFSLIIE